MKKALFILGFLFFAVVAFGQNQKGTVVTLAADTLTNTTAKQTVITPVFAGQNMLIVQSVYTNLTGTTAGTAYLQGSLDGTSYKIINTTGELLNFPNDTLTVINGVVGMWVIKDTPYRYFRVAHVPSGIHTTRVVTKYTIK